MKVKNWVYKNKFPLMVAAFIVVSALLVFVFIGSLKTDYSLKMVKQELKLEEKHRALLEQERKEHQKVVDAKDEFIMAKLDSLKANDILKNNLSKQYNEKAKIINTFGSDELRDYFRNLPNQTDNDY